jgi:FkbM family methyltransferase
MSRLSSLLYRKVRSPSTVEENFRVMKKLGLHITWVIEAGCHDGTDTEKMMTSHGVEKIYAFEPDSAAREIASSRLAKFSHEQISISPYALMNQPGVFEIDFLGSPGSGSTQIRKFVKLGDREQIQAIRLDDFTINQISGGFLWLDVEGSAFEVLAGGVRTLRKISAINIEVEFHDMSKTRASNFRKVTKTLRSQGFGIWASDIHPGYFGNIFLVRTNLLSQTKRFIMQTRYLRLWVLHSFIYPALNKPAKIRRCDYN